MAIEYTEAAQECFHVRFEGQLLEGMASIARWNNTWHVVRDAADPIDPEDEIALYQATFDVAEAMYAWYGEELIPLLANNVILTNARCQQVVPTRGPFSDFGGGAVGAAGMGIDEPDDAAVMQKRTARAGRMFQGRVYIPGLPDESVSGGALEVIACSAMIDALEPLLTSGLTAGGETYRLVVFSEKRFSETPDILEAAAIIQALTVDRVVRRMGSRELPYRTIVGNV